VHNRPCRASNIQSVLFVDYVLLFVIKGQLYAGGGACMGRPTRRNSMGAGVPKTFNTTCAKRGDEIQNLHRMRRGEAGVTRG
jgi:hypothetical protein